MRLTDESYIIGDIMKYDNIKKARFLNRPNRFIANIEIDGREEVAHVKNTGRCRELLTEGAEVYVYESDNKERKTKYDLITVKKGDRLINMDSQAPNKIFYEWVTSGNLFKDISYIKPECKYENSRFDFYIEADNKKIFVEVKGVTLEDNGVVRFPDAPTERGVKHINELISAKGNGYDAYIVFIIQMDNVKYLEPNYKTHKEFGEALRIAKDKGVNIIAVNCDVTENTVCAKEYVPVKL